MFDFEIDHSLEDPVWDAFVAGSPDAHHEQTTLWAGLKRSQGWQAYRVLVRDKGRLAGGAQVLHRPVKRLASVGFLSSGPVAGQQDAYPHVTQQVVEGLKQTGHTYLALLPNYNWGGITPVLASNGFFPKPNLLPPSNLVTATLMIDLTQDLDVILGQMNRLTRRQIRRGEKAGIEVVQGGAADIGTFHNLMSQLCARRGVSPRPATVEECHQIWRHLAPSGMARLFLARYQSKEVSALFAFVWGGTIRVWKAGWTGEQDLGSNHVLWWELIQWAKAAGLRQIDFDQILPEHARAILEGKTVDDHYWGVTQFKLGFGGKVTMVPDAYYRSFNLPAQAMLQLGGAKAVASARMSKWAGRLQ